MLKALLKSMDEFSPPTAIVTNWPGLATSAIQGTAILKTW
jgi:hypothetical protein